MIFTVLNEAAEKGNLILVEGGLCRYHRRKDGVVVIHEIIVLPESRRMGIGRLLVEEVADWNPSCTLRVKCPQKYESNAFWPAIGFVLVETKEGINLWERCG